jgi:hypothetical protein
MKELDYNYNTELPLQNESIQLDTFEATTIFGGKDRYIFDFTKVQDFGALDPYAGEVGEGNLYVYPEVFGGPEALIDSRGNRTPDGGETLVQGTSSGYKYRWLLNNLTYWDQSWDLLGHAGNGEFIFKDYPAIVLTNQAAPTFPNLTYIETPSTGNLNIEDGPVYKNTVVPYINKDIAFAIPNSNVQCFRSGYVEFTIKTDNNNCIIGAGYTSASMNEPTIIDKDIILKNITGINDAEFKISIKNGKLRITHREQYNKNANDIDIISNKTISDNEWHHIVINIGKKGINRTKNKKYNKRFIEVFIDGKSDIINYDIDKRQIYFPLIEWLFVDPTLTFTTLKNPILGYDSTIDLYGGVPWAGGGTTEFFVDNAFVGNNEENNVSKAIFNSIADSVNFSGAMNTFALGVNNALSTEEIQLRYSLYISQKLYFAQSITAKAEMINPTVNTNSKKALKLFWNNINNLSNGIELDSNFSIDSYSVTHKNIISSTETYNIDLTNESKINYLNDIRAVFIDNINLIGPGKLFNQSLSKFVSSNPYFGGVKDQGNFKTSSALDSARYPDWWTPGGYRQTKEYKDYAFTDGALINMPFSGLNLNDGDKILLTNQIKEEENGIYVFNGYNNPLTRPENLSSPDSLNYGVVRVIDGYFKDTSWILSNIITSIGDVQKWVQLENHPTELDLKSQPILTDRWLGENYKTRMIDLGVDLDITKYDLIVFMNYPKTNEEIKENFVGYDDFEIQNIYNNFIKSLKTVVANGASLYVSSPRLATDLGIVKAFTEVPQLLQDSDAASASLSPFELTEPAERYFDTHRNNKYNVATIIPGLTNKETYLLTDFINFTPESEYDYDQYHAKYSYRQFGLQEGNEFIIPGSTLRKITENESLPGYKDNQLGTKSLMTVEPSNILTGTVVTKLANNYYDGSTITVNPYDDYATTIIVHNGQLLGDTPINGKIFINCVEDGYTFSREEYNKAKIQVLPETDTNETVATRAWQYSTTRLDRKPQRLNISGLSSYGQTTPTDGGGGAFIQAPSNSSNGIIRSKADKGNVDYQSDLYPTEEEEIYPLQEIPVLSMTWLGLQWLAG